MLKLFRRHTEACLADLAAKTLKPEAVRTWPHCECAVWFSGHWNGKTYPRTSMKVNDWKRAEKELGKMIRGEDQFRLNGITIADALEKWHRDCALPPALSPDTIAEHRSVGNWLLEFAKSHRISLLADFDVELLNLWRASWGVADSTHRTRLGFVGAFFNYAMKRQAWIEKNPVDRIVKLPSHPPTKEDTQPIDTDGTEMNWLAIVSAMAQPAPPRLGTRGRERYTPIATEPPRLVALTEVMYHSGPRVSDAIMLDLRKLIDHLEDDCASYEYVPIKRSRSRGKRTPVTTFMPLWLAAKLRALTCSVPHLPFLYNNGTSRGVERARKTVARQFDDELKRIGKAAGLVGLRSHRFRNSFAVNALISGVDLADVSKWLGHKSIKTTELYYSPWVTARVSRSRKIYAQSHDTTKPVIDLGKGPYG